MEIVSPKFSFIQFEDYPPDNEIVSCNFKPFQLCLPVYDENDVAFQFYWRGTADEIAGFDGSVIELIQFVRDAMIVHARVETEYESIVNYGVNAGMMWIVRPTYEHVYRNEFFATATPITDNIGGLYVGGVWEGFADPQVENDESGDCLLTPYEYKFRMKGSFYIVTGAPVDSITAAVITWDGDTSHPPVIVQQLAIPFSYSDGDPTQGSFDKTLTGSIVLSPGQKLYCAIAVVNEASGYDANHVNILFKPETSMKITAIRKCPGDAMVIGNPDIIPISDTESLFYWSGLPGFKDLADVGECFQIKATIYGSETFVSAYSNCLQRIGDTCHTALIEYECNENAFDFIYCDPANEALRAAKIKQHSFVKNKKPLIIKP